MPKPTEDVRELLRAIQTEIGAGKGFASDPLTSNLGALSGHRHQGAARAR